MSKSNLRQFPNYGIELENSGQNIPCYTNPLRRVVIFKPLRRPNPLRRPKILCGGQKAATHYEWTEVRDAHDLYLSQLEEVTEGEARWLDEIIDHFNALEIETDNIIKPKIVGKSNEATMKTNLSTQCNQDDAEGQYKCSTAAHQARTI